MKIIETAFEKLPRERLVIGFEGENLRATVRIDCASVFSEYPNATPALIVKPLFADAYPVVVDRNGTDVDWLITSEILSFSGDGEIQLVFYKGEVICKSAVSKIRVSRSLQVTGEMPDPVVQWIENANRKLAEVDAQIVELEGMVDTATDAATSAEQSASTASTKAEQAAGSAATATEKAIEATNAAGTATAKAAEAQTAAQTATEKATAAAESERIATAKAVEATTAAGTATTKAEQATEAAQTATEKAADASASARAAHASATDAASSATAASASETAAKASETAASTSASQAAQSVLDAGANAQTAMQKAAEATQSATNAAASATSAATSAETASTKAGEAAQSAQAVAETAEQLAESLEQISQNTADIAEHEQEYNALKEATLIHNTASGAIASFVDGAEMPVDEVTAQINPVQDLHGYDHPWSAGGGVNKADLTGATAYGDGVYGMYVTVDGEEITLAGTWTNSNATGIWRFLSVPNIPSDLNVVAFESTSGNHVSAIRQDGTNKRLIITATNMVNGQAYTIKFKIVAYEGSTAPTAWTPYSNICPITGFTGANVTRTGKNLLNNVLTSCTLYGTTFTVNSDGSITVSGTPSAQARVPICSGLAWDGRAYVTFSFGDMPTGTRVFARKVYNGVQNYPTINPTSNQPVGALIYDVYLEINTSFNGTAFTVYPQCEFGSTATTYEPYQGETYPITFPSEAGTVYGGSLSIAEDGSGVLTVDRFNKNITSALKSTGDNGYFWYSSATGQSIPSIKGLNSKLISNRMKAVANATLSSNDGEISFYANGIIRWKEQGNMSKEEYNAYLAENPLQICYEMAEPITYTLTAAQITTLLGMNNIWADTGDVSVKYKANTKLYIDGKIAELVAQIVNS